MPEDLTGAAAGALLRAVTREARARGLTVSVAVSDVRGDRLAFLRADGATALALALASAKAYTAAVMGRPIRDLRGWQQEQPELFLQLTHVNRYPLIADEGGLPVTRDGAVIGGLGVVAEREADEHAVCAAALAALGYGSDPEAAG